MINQIGIPTQDTEKPDPKELASTLKNQFDSYYRARKAVLDRKMKDLKVLKSRSNVKTNNVPEAANNLATAFLKKEFTVE